MTLRLDRPVPWLLVVCAVCVVAQPAAHSEEASPIRVACLGDSITAGARVDANSESYPARLQELLGARFEVRNFGIGGATLIKAGQPNIWSRLDEVKKFQPHVAVISLGTNDTVGGSRRNWERIERFDQDYSDLIKTLAESPSKPRIVVCTPTAMVLQTPGLSEQRLADLTERKPRLQELCRRIRRLAEKHAEQGVTLLELNAVLEDRPQLLSRGDGVHPNAPGYQAIAEAVADHIRRPGKRPPPVEEQSAEAGRRPRHGWRLRPSPRGQGALPRTCCRAGLAASGSFPGRGRDGLRAGQRPAPIA